MDRIQHRWTWRQDLWPIRNRHRAYGLQPCARHSLFDYVVIYKVARIMRNRVAFSNVWAAIESGIALPGGKECIDVPRRRQDLLKEELADARAVETAEFD